MTQRFENLLLIRNRTKQSLQEVSTFKVCRNTSLSAPRKITHIVYMFWTHWSFVLRDPLVRRIRLDRRASMVAILLLSLLTPAAHASASSEDLVLDKRFSSFTVFLTGPYARENLSRLYSFLIRERPEIIVPRQLTQSEYPWDDLYDSGIWPSQLGVVESLREALRKPGTSTAYYVPEVSTAVFVSVGRDTVQLVVGEEELPKRQQEIQCRNYGWTTAAMQKGCVILVTPQTGSYANRTFEKSSKPDLVVREIIVAQPGIAVTLLKRVEVDAQHKLAQQIRAHFEGLGVPRSYLSFGWFDADSPPEGTEPRGADASMLDGCYGAIELSGLSAYARSALDWPDSVQRATKQTRLVVIDGEVAKADGRIYVDPDRVAADEYDEATLQRLHDPYVWRKGLPRPLDRACSHVGKSGGSESYWEHPVAVASAVFGARTKIAVVRGPTLEIFGYLEPGVLLYVAPASFKNKSIFLSPHGQQVFLFPYQETPPEQNNTVRQLIEEPYLAATSGAVMVISAPVVSSPNQGTYADVEDVRDWDDGATKCEEWPACLGASPFAIVVAAIGKDGLLMEEDPGTHKRYKLGSSVVSIAALGEAVPTAGLQDGHVVMTASSGSSLAAPAVAAVALRLHAMKDGYQAQYVVARILSTADLTKNFDGKVRFGTLNARRAFLGDGGTKSESMLQVRTDNERADASQPATPAQIAGLSYRNVCQKHEAAPLGYLPYYYPNQNYVGPGARQLDCIAVHRLLRIRATGSDSFGNPLFAIVYFEDGRAGFRSVQYPRIVRNVLLRSQDGRALCSVAGGPLKTVDPWERPCLTATFQDGTQSGIDLTATDIVFSRNNILVPYDEVATNDSLG